jgi:hypothetical protein
MKSIMRTAFCILAALLSLPAVGQTAKAPQPSTLTVRVTDQLGAVIGKAFVFLHSDALERENPKPFRMEPSDRIQSTSPRSDTVSNFGFSHT